MEHEVTRPIFQYELSYRRVPEVQVRLLSRGMQGDLPEYTGFCTRQVRATDQGSRGGGDAKCEADDEARSA